MKIAIGYKWFETAAGYHLERAFNSQGHRVVYVGLPCEKRPGYDSQVSLEKLIGSCSEGFDFYFWVDPSGPYFPLGIENLSIPTACYIIDVHLGTWRYEAARFFDVVFIAQKDYVEGYRRKLGHDRVYWLPLAAASDFHNQQNLPRIYDVGFVGNISLAHRSSPRSLYLNLLAKEFTTNDFYRFYTPREVGRVYSQSKIVFNTSIAGDITMRVFEAALSGALVVSDSEKNGVEELFRLGKEIVIYHNVDDLLTKIRYYLAHDKERGQIAEAGHRRALSQHTYGERVSTIADYMSQPSLRKCAPMRKASSSQKYKGRHTVYTHLHMVDAVLELARKQDSGPLRRFTQVLPVLARKLII